MPLVFPNQTRDLPRHGAHVNSHRAASENGDNKLFVREGDSTALLQFLAEASALRQFFGDFHIGFVPLQAGYWAQPQNCEPARAPFLAVRNAMGLPQSGQLGAPRSSVWLEMAEARLPSAMFWRPERAACTNRFVSTARPWRS